MIHSPKVSVIVPVFNVDNYLHGCLDSIIKQTLREIEIICVDDGSTDKSSEILEDYARKDDRIRVIHEENSGYGKAVNSGFEMAQGEYVAIVESDDMIFCNMYEKLYSLAYKHDLDLIKGECFFCWDKTGYRVRHYLPAMERYYNIVLKDEDRETFFGFFMNTWSGIYKKTFLNQFDIKHHQSPGASFQDNGFWMQTMYFASRAMWIDDPLYLYRQDNESASIHSEGKVFAMLDEYKWVEQTLKEKGVEEENLGYCRFFRLFRQAGNMIRIADDKKEDFAKIILEDYHIHQEALRVFQDNGIRGWFQRLADNPKEFCMHIIKKKEMILTRLNNTKRVYIYGIGSRAVRVFRLLCYNRLLNNFEGFIVSSDLIDVPSIGFYSVSSIHDPRIDLQDCEVIIGAGKNSRSHREIEELLRMRDVVDYLECEDFFDSFYLVF